jgi:glycosyltransferase involved in cell wall biosynthesis
MKILIDLQACQSSSRFRGIGRYAMSIAQAMVRHAGEHEIWLALNSYVKSDIISIKQSFLNLIPPERVVVFSVPGPLAGIDPLHAWRVRASELIRWHALVELKPDIIYIASLFEGFVDSIATSIEPVERRPSHAVTLYDLIPLKNREEHLKTPIHQDWYLNKLQSLKRAEILLAISEYTRKEAIDLLELPGEQVVNISAGVSDCFHPLFLSPEASDRLLLQYSIKRPFLLYTGNLDANKNLKGTILAYSCLPFSLRQIHQLVIVSQMNTENLLLLNQYKEKCGLNEDEVVFTGYISDDHLVKLYNLCKAFVFPSLNEGFGLPVLEAMSCGAACIGSNATSIPEVIGRQDALFDPHVPGSIANAMHHVLINEDFRQSLRDHSLIQSRRFSWDTTACRALTIFETIHNQSKSASIPHRLPVDILRSANRDNYTHLIEAIAQIDSGAEPTEDDISQAAYSISVNEASSCNKQLIVDVSTIISHDAKTGIQRVVRSVLHQLFDKPIAGYTIRLVYGDDKIGYFRYADKFQACLLGNSASEGQDSVIDYKRGDVFLGLDLSAHLFPVFTPVLENFRAIGVSVHFIVYDILPLINRLWFADGMEKAFMEWMEAISCHADSLICISAAVADEVRQWVHRHPPERPDKIQITHFHLGADIDNSMPTYGMPENANTILSVFKANPTFLMVGTIEPRKNHAQVLAAFEYLWRKNTTANLVFVGKAGWNIDGFKKQLNRHKELNSRLFWLEGISDEFLSKIYQASSALVVASQAEGFGLPLIEAAQHRLPIIARDISVFREVAGDHAYYFEGHEPMDLAEAITQWFKLSKSNQAPQSGNISWLTWEESTKLLLDITLGRNRA